MDEIFSLGQWIKRRRKARDLTQDALAQRVGCSKELIVKIEADARRPSRQIAERLAEYLGLAADERVTFLQAARAELGVERLAPPAHSVPQLALAPAAALPHGTVTFLFTDIEGSTQLWAYHARQMSAGVTRHEALLREAITAADGVIFKTVGDAVYAAFASALDAVTAAVEGQRALSAEAWGLRVRMALHSGVVEAHGGDYLGLPLSRVARLLAAGHGGQILLSLATEQLVREQLPPDVMLRDLGSHRLKDLILPEQIFQLVAPDLPSDFPPLHTLAERRTNLLAQPTALIGREREIADVSTLLRRADVRLVTLTGSGGVGKTRLSLQVAAELLDEFADGVWLVNLAPISDLELVVTTIAQVLDVHEVGGQLLRDLLKHYLREKQMLLLLDNFEQVLDASLLVAELLATAPGLNILVTSRAVLHLSGEHEYVVPPLALPDRHQLPPLEQLAHYDAVRLFIERARAVKADFAVTNANAPAVAEICSRLDGLPLAIELAAARSKLFPPGALLARLRKRLDLLTEGARDLPARQQTIRNTIDWSYQLLTVHEQRVFRHLGVFVGDFTLAAAEAVCRGGIGQAGDTARPHVPMDYLTVLEALSGLVDQSLVQHGTSGTTDGDVEGRFRLLELVREYAYELLVESGEALAVQRRHAAYYLALAEAGTRQASGSTAQIQGFERLELERDNLGAALQWALDHREGALAVRFAAALAPLWLRRGDIVRGSRWLNAALVVGAHDPTVDPSLHAEALFALTTLVSWGGAIEPAVLAACPAALEPLDALLGACQALYEELGDRAGVASVLGLRAWKAWRSDYPLAGALHEEELALARASGSQSGLAEALKGLGRVSYNLGDFARAFTLFEESMAIQQALGDRYAIAGVHFDLGVAAYYQGDFPRATSNLERMVALCRELGDRGGIPAGLIHLAGVAGHQGDYQRARDLLDEALALYREQGDLEPALVLRFEGQLACQQSEWGIAQRAYRASLQAWQALDVKWEVAACLEGLGWVAAGQGDSRQAARLWGAAAELRAQLGAPLLPVDKAWYEALLARVRVMLGEAAFAAAWDEGQAMPLEQVIAEALG
jgi:predicted ATPase/class 3 adenylate cyclase